jgi:predicted nucleic acid-binding protein
VALRNRSEREHELARSTLAELVQERALLFTSNYVFAETYTALLVRLGRGEAIEWGRRFHAGRAIELIRVEQPVEQEAWSILETHTDKEWSYVDATSFALIERERLTAAFAFDRHFAQRGLKVLPGA